MKTLLQFPIALSIMLQCSMQVFSQGGNVGIGTVNPLHPLHVETTASMDGSRAIFGLATAGSGTTFGVFGQSSSTSGRGVFGEAIASSGFTYGVRGQSSSNDGRGVHGLATASSGLTFGVIGQSSSTDGHGVFGWATAGSGTTIGVRGQSSSTDGHGVFGWATAGSGTTYGVVGESSSTSGRGVYGNATASSGTTIGVYGESSSTNGRGVYGQATAGSGNTYGVQGQNSSTSGRGVYGNATASIGTTYGVYGQSSSTSGRGVYGLAAASSGTTYGIYGTVSSPDGYAGYFTGPLGSLNYFQRSVGIGTSNPGAFLLAVSGTAAKTGGGEWSVFSDARLKHSIERVQPGMLDRVLQLKGYTFEYDDHAIEKRLALPGRQIGLIAQQVREVFPEWVDSDDEGFLFVTVRSLAPIMVESLRELRAEKDAEIEGLKTENLALSIRLSKLEERVEKLLQQQELEYAQKD